MTDIVKIGALSTGATDAGADESLTISHTLAGGYNRLMLISYNSSSSTAPVITCTYGGIECGNVSFQRFAAANLNQGMFQIEENELFTLTNGLPYDVVISWTGGTNMEIEATVEMAGNVQQIGGVINGFDTENSATVITNDDDTIADSWTVRVVSCQDIGETFTHNNSQVEILDNSPYTGFTGAVTSTIYTPAVTTDWTSTKTGASDRMMGLIVSRVEEPITIIEFATTISVTSTVSGYFRQDLSTTIAAASTVAADLHRNRGYVTTVTVAPSVVTADLARLVDFLGSLTESATIVSPTFKKDSALRALVPVVPTVTGLFEATRPLAATLDATTIVTAQFGSDFAETTTSLTPGCYIELFEVDTTVIGGGDVFRFVPHGYEVSNVFWQGNEYIRFPVEIDGFEWNATAQAPPQPTLRLSNVNKFVLGAVLTLGDLVGARVTRWRTYIQFLDNQPQADPNAHFPPDIFYVQQKTSHDKIQIEWSLSSALDLPGVRLPRRQILRDDTTGNLYAPGVAQVRFRGR